MVSAQHRDWLNRGRPDSGLARPLAQLRDVLRAAGYTVFDFPDDGHLDAEPPEDHTQYSETGWPSTSPKWWRHAIDIMPPTKPGLPSLTELGDRIVSDRNAGHITWLKYINWPSTGSLSAAVQDGWKPGHYRRPSSDTGHIHLSSITGVENLDAPYNPLIAAQGEAIMALSQDDIINVASAVVQWATEGGALPGNFRGAHTNLLSLEAQLTALADSMSKVRVELQAVRAALDTQPAGGSTASGDVTVSGTLHLGTTGSAS
jgi:hypothetical protein